MIEIDRCAKFSLAVDKKILKALYLFKLGVLWGRDISH